MLLFLGVIVGCELYSLFQGVIGVRVDLVEETFSLFVWGTCSSMYMYS